MLSRFQQLRDERESGFTLIELLVVVAIIGILAAIAIPVFISQRDNAANSAAESEIKNAATVIEVAYTENGKFPTLAEIQAGTPTVTVSDNVAMTYTPTAATGTDPAKFVLKGCNIDTRMVFTWDSSVGAFDPAEPVLATGTECDTAGITG